MPHVIVKLHSGRSEQQKAALAEAATRAVVDTRVQRGIGVGRHRRRPTEGLD
jgi:hypothetical protein